MTRLPTEDVPYEIDDFALEDAAILDNPDEEQTIETKVFQEIRKYLKEAIAEHNSVEIIDLTEQAKMTPTQQIAVHKVVIEHLRNIGNTINDKVKEN